MHASTKGFVDENYDSTLIFIFLLFIPIIKTFWPFFFLLLLVLFSVTTQTARTRHKQIVFQLNCTQKTYIYARTKITLKTFFFSSLFSPPWRTKSLKKKSFWSEYSQKESKTCETWNYQSYYYHLLLFTEANINYTEKKFVLFVNYILFFAWLWGTTKTKKKSTTTKWIMNNMTNISWRVKTLKN